MKAIKFFERYSILLVFIIYFFTGFSVVDDYGISIDEEFQRFSGFYWLNYVLEFLPFDQLRSEVLIKLNNIGGFTLPDPIDYPFYGVTFDLPLAFIETISNITESKDYFILRHKITFLVFFISSIFFFKTLKLRLNNKIIIFLGLLLYIGSPRIFGDSFFNNKDLIFLSLVTITFYYYLRLVVNLNYKNIILFSLFSSITCSLRILGIFIPLSFISILIIKNNFKKNKFFISIIYLSCFIFGLIFFWPYLWANPAVNFYQAFITFSKYESLAIQMLFNGNYIFSNFLPMSYLPTWIVLTTPLISIILFLLGYIYLFKRFFTRLIKVDTVSNLNDFWRGKNEEMDFIIFFNFSLIFFYIIFFSPVLYTGWRHLYFLHTFMTYICCIALYSINLKFKNRIVIFVISLIICANFYEIKKFHPFQSLYFNQLLQENKKNSFEVDYWAIGGTRFLKEIISIHGGDKIKIATASYAPLERSLKLLKQSEQNKIEILGQEYSDADYIYNNNISEVNKYRNNKYLIPKNFEKISEFKIRGYMIYEIYKKF